LLPSSSCLMMVARDSQALSRLQREAKAEEERQRFASVSLEIQI
jgi:hypothetical protein